MAKGGKRAGSGRPKGIPTKPIRVPVDMVEEIEALILNKNHNIIEVHQHSGDVVSLSNKHKMDEKYAEALVRNMDKNIIKEITNDNNSI